MANKSCPKCKSFVGSLMNQFRFCEVCGGELVNLPVCSCKYEFGTTEKFCPKCGKPRPIQ